MSCSAGVTFRSSLVHLPPIFYLSVPYHLLIYTSLKFYTNMVISSSYSVLADLLCGKNGQKYDESRLYDSTPE